MTRQHWPDWTPQDELILAQQEVARLEKEFRGATTPRRHEIQPELLAAHAEVTKWKAIVNKK